jgi:hypothetical protein
MLFQRIVDSIRYEKMLIKEIMYTKILPAVDISFIFGFEIWTIKVNVFL